MSRDSGTRARLVVAPAPHVRELSRQAVSVGYFLRKKGEGKNMNAGTRYGRLVVVGNAGPGRQLVRCDCGNDKIVFTASLYGGSTRSCGCLRQELQRDFKARRLAQMKRVAQQRRVRMVF